MPPNSARCKAGFGIGGCQIGLAMREPELVAVLPGQVEFGLEMWLAMHEDLRASRRVRLVFDHLAAGLGGVCGGGRRGSRAGSRPGPRRGRRRQKSQEK